MLIEFPLKTEEFSMKLGMNIGHFSGLFKAGAISAVLVILSACSERDLQTSFLKSLPSDSTFSVTNAKNQSELDPSADLKLVPVEVTCAETVSKIEVLNPITGEWTLVSSLDGTADVDCADEKASFRLPLAFLDFPYQPPNAGAVRKEFKLRWTFLDFKKEPQMRMGTYAVFAESPTGTLAAPNAAIANANNYTVTGTCADAGDIEVSGPYPTPLITSCSAGIWTATGTVSSSSPSQVVVQARIYKGSGSLRGPFVIQEKNVKVDLVAPTLVLSEPGDHDVYIAGQPLHFKGSCSETMMPVKILQGTALLVEGVCSAAGSFDIEASSLADGSYSSVTASQTDDVGNGGSSSAVSFSKDTVGPGAFAIQGVTSIDGNDTVVDGFLRAPGLRTTHEAAPEASLYNLEVKDSLGTVICSKPGVSSLAVDWTSCSLNNGSSYKLYVTALDAPGNTTVASNSGFSFQVNYDIPVITSVLTPSSSAAYTIGAALSLNVRFTQKVQVTGTPVLQLNASGTSSAIYASGSGSDTLIFSYTVASGDNTEKLDYASISSLTGNIVWFGTSLAANLTLPPLGTGSLQATKTIIIDTTPPAPPTGLTMESPRLDEVGIVPAISWTPSSSSDVVGYAVELVRTNTSSVVMTWSYSPAVVSQFRQELATLNPLEVLSLRVRAVDRVGQVTYSAPLDYTTAKCPYNYVFVSGRLVNGTNVPSFCVAKYEMRYGASGDGYGVGNAAVSPVSRGNERPWTGLTRSQATGRCQTGGYPQYNLISNNQWQVLANNLADHPTNWVSEVSYSSLGMKSGVYASSGPQASTGGLRGSGKGERVLLLPNQSEIWDVSGNVAEWTSDTAALVPTGSAATNFISIMLPSLFSPLTNCAGAGASPFCGYGKYTTSVSDGFAVRGGSYLDDGNTIGIFAVEGRDGSTSSMSGALDIGFRCVYNPN